MEKSLTEKMRYTSPFGDKSVFNQTSITNDEKPDQQG